MPGFLKDFVNAVLPPGSPARTKAYRLAALAAGVATAAATLLAAAAEVLK